TKTLFEQRIDVDVLIADVGLAILSYSVQRRHANTRILRADTSAELGRESKMEGETKERDVTVYGTREWMMILGVAFGAVALSHFGADLLVPFFTEHFPGAARYSLTSGFFWVVIIATTCGVLLSFTKARSLEHFGASNVGSLFLYVL